MKYFRRPTARLWDFTRCTRVQRCPKITELGRCAVHKPTAGSHRANILFWHWPQLLIVNWKDIWLTCIPGRLPWTGEWAMVMLTGSAPRPRAALLGFTYVYSPGCAAVNVSSSPGQPGDTGLPRTVSGIYMWRENVLPHTLVYLPRVGTTPSHPKQLSKLTDVRYC